MPFVALTNFSKGEISPELQARIDTGQYGAGARRMRNFLIQRYGGASFRPGFRFVGEVDNPTTAVRYVPFQYNIEQAYIMAIDNQKMRLLAQGGFVVEDNLAITAITKAANALVTSAFHALLVGDRIYFSGIVGMVEINGMFGVVATVPTANTFTVNIDTTAFTTFVSSDGIIRTGPPAAPPAPPAPPAVPPAIPPAAPSTDAGGSGADLGGYDLYLRYGYYP